MVRTLGAFLIVGSFLSSASAAAQSGQGSLNGYVKDEQGGILPGATVTATGPSLLAPVVGVTDNAGYYRLQNLPPGLLTVTAELSGFATFRREGILMRAGSTFTVDIELKVGTLSETVTVAGESPMVSTGLPTKTLTVEGDLLRAAPISPRRAFSDVLDMAPGVNSRNSDGASGVRMYYFHGTTLFSTVITLEGAPAGTYNDASAFQINMAGETTADAEVKLGGVDASSPTGTSVVMNIMAPRGGNMVKGTVQYEGVRLEQRQHAEQRGAGWNSDQSIDQPVGRVTRRPHQEGQDVGVRCVPLRRSGHRRQPTAIGSRVRYALSDDPVEFSAVQQLQQRKSAVREGDDTGEPEARGDGALPIPARDQFQRPRARPGSDLLQ